MKTVFCQFKNCKPVAQLLSIGENAQFCRGIDGGQDRVCIETSTGKLYTTTVSRELIEALTKGGVAKRPLGCPDPSCKPMFYDGTKCVGYLVEREIDGRKENYSICDFQQKVRVFLNHADVKAIERLFNIKENRVVPIVFSLNKALKLAKHGDVVLVGCDASLWRGIACISLRGHATIEHVKAVVRGTFNATPVVVEEE